MRIFSTPLRAEETHSFSGRHSKDELEAAEADATAVVEEGAVLTTLPHPRPLRLLGCAVAGQLVGAARARHGWQGSASQALLLRVPGTANI